MTRIPEIGTFLDEEEKSTFGSLEDQDAPLTSILTPLRRKAIEEMARATIDGDQAEIVLRVPKSDLIRLKSRALQEGVSYEAVINALIHKFVS